MNHTDSDTSAGDWPRRGCPPESALAASASGDDPGGLIASHASSCAACRAAFDDLREGERFTARFAGVLSPALRPGSSPPADASGSVPVIPGYTVGGELSRGGQGVVYRAVQHETRRAVAIKVMLRGLFASQREIARFEREVEIAASLRHPGIVTVFEARLLEDGRHALIMDLIEGEPLSAWATRAPTGREGFLRRLGVVREVALAVHYAHGRGVIHRDLKPGNIVIDAAGEPHVLDFGLARRGIETPPGGTRTVDPKRSWSGAGLIGASMVGVFQGTPAYAAPEQFEDEGSAVDVRADVYSLGVMLHELLSGQPPFGASTAGLTEIVGLKRSGGLIGLKARASALGLVGAGTDAEAVVGKATSVGREDRYPSALALADDLAALMRGGAVAARTGRLYRARKFARRHAAALAVSTAVVVAAGAGITVLARSEFEARAARSLADLERSRSRLESARAEAVSHLIDELLPIDDPGLLTEVRGPKAGVYLLQSKVQDGAWSDRPLVRAGVHSLLAQVYEDRGVLNWALVHRLRGAGEVHRVYGPSHPEMAEALHHLARVLLARGEFDDAEQRAREALRVRSASLGTGHADTARDLSLIARILLAKGDPAGALRDATRAEAVLAAERPGTIEHALSGRVLSDALAASGRAAESTERALTSLRMILEHSLDEDPEVSRALTHYGSRIGGPRGDTLRRAAMDLNAARRDDRPTEAWSRWVEVKSGLLSPTHPSVALTLMFWARVEVNRRNFTAAQSAAQRALDAYEHEYGPEARELCDALELLNHARGSVFNSRRSAEDSNADALGRRLRILRATAGPFDELEVMVAWREYGASLMWTGRVEAAEKELRSCIARWEEIGRPVYESARPLNYLAYVHMLSGRVGEALEPARRAHGLAMRFEPEREETRWFDFVLGAALALNGREHEGAPLVVAGVGFAEVFVILGEPNTSLFRRVADALDRAGEDRAAASLREAIRRGGVTPDDVAASK